MAIDELSYKNVLSLFKTPVTEWDSHLKCSRTSWYQAVWSCLDLWMIQHVVPVPKVWVTKCAAMIYHDFNSLHPTHCIALNIFAKYSYTFDVFSVLKRDKSDLSLLKFKKIYSCWHHWTKLKLWKSAVIRPYWDTVCACANCWGIRSSLQHRAWTNSPSLSTKIGKTMETHNLEIFGPKWNTGFDIS